MGFREKSAWAVIGTLVLAYGGYVVAVLGRVGAGGVDGVSYVDAAVGGAVATVALLAAAHIAIAVIDRPAARARVAAAPRVSPRRSPGATILAVGAVVALGLTMTDAAPFWTANVLIAALVAGEIATAADRITDERAATRRA